MKAKKASKPDTYAVGIDLGTTYSCLAYLNEHGEPVAVPNKDGELSTPSVVLFDGKDVEVGGEALRNAIAHPDRVVQNAKRFMGDTRPRWTVDGVGYSPVDIQAFILKALLSNASERLGTIEEAVITVPALFGDVERKATIEAGMRAGLKRVHLINEPVSAALCYVLGSVGLWFSEIAKPQRVLVYDLGGGTFDISLVNYAPNEVRVIASSGDLHLGGIDFNEALARAVSEQFVKEFSTDPRENPQSLQALAIEVEQTKRSLSARQRAALTCQHAGHRKAYQIQREQFERLTRDLVSRTENITVDLVKKNGHGWAEVDVVLTTGGASRMPMIRRMLQDKSGQTLNTSLSPDLSIAHGAAFYAGMLITNADFARAILDEPATKRLSQMRQKSVTARGLGILVRDAAGTGRVPHYLIAEGTELPAAVTQIFGTVIPDQKRVHVYVVESVPGTKDGWVNLGSCTINDLPPDLPAGSAVAVTISYDAAACVHLSATDVKSGNEATIEFVRPESISLEPVLDLSQEREDLAVGPPPQTAPKGPSADPEGKQAFLKDVALVSPEPKRQPAAQLASRQPVLPRAIQPEHLEAAWQPVALCNRCGRPLDALGACPQCVKQQGEGAPKLPK